MAKGRDLVDGHDALVEPVARFVEEVGRALARLVAQAGDDDTRGTARDDAALEAASIVAAFIDADTVHTDAELWSYLRAFAGLLDPAMVAATPNDVRRAGLVAGRRAFLTEPSALFRLLVDADAADGGRRSWGYYREAMALGHRVASLDVHTSRAELDALSRYRTLLLSTIRAAGIRRPGPDFFGTADAAPQDQDSPQGRAPTQPPQDRQPPTGEPARPVDEVLAELDALVGLEPVKAEVRLVANLLIVQGLRRKRGLPTVEGARHLVFTGNPGTGKTTVARLLGEIYRSLGVVVRGHLVEVDRSRLVAGYVGQTATRTREALESALDGVLLIDEAHALARGNEQDFGREAIDTIVKVMEDERERLVVIAAGYPDEMAAFLAANPGLSSRFPKTIHFPDYTRDELVAIFDVIATRHRYELDADARDALRDHFEAIPRAKGFGNGRAARNLFEAAVARQASRLVSVDAPTDRDLLTLTRSDVLGSGG